MKDGHICGVEFLKTATDDERIAEAHELLRSKGAAIGADGFELWDGRRFVYRFVGQGTAQAERVGDARKRSHWFQQLMRGSKSDTSDFDMIADYPCMAAFGI